MNGTLAAEALALATGIFPKRLPTPFDVARAKKIHARVQTALRYFLKAEKPDKWEAWTRPPPQDELHMDLSTPVTAEDWPHEDSQHLPLEIVPQWLMVVNQARKYCCDKWPIYDAESLTPANFALAEDELGDVWEIVRALDGEENFLADLKAHVLSPPQVDAVKACFPDFYETCFGASPSGQSTPGVVPILFEELTRVVAQKRTLTEQQEDMIRVLEGLPDQAPITIKPQAPILKTPPGGGKKMPKSSADKADVRTQTRSEALELRQQNAK